MKILVVDDDHRIVNTTCDILKIKGHEPVAASGISSNFFYEFSVLFKLHSF